MRLILALWALVSTTQLCLSNDRVDKIFARWDKTNSPGCALAVIQKGKIVYQRGYGMADLDHDLAITPESVFHVASVSKQFTAAAIVLLAQQGKLSLDDPVRKHITELADFGKPLTIRHLIHHVSGLRDQWTLLTLSGWRLSEDVVRDEDVMYLVSRMKELNFPPGERYLYSNTGYTVLAQIVKRVSGKSLREFTTQNIFGPLGMQRTFFRDDHLETVKNMAYGYQQTGGRFRQSIPHYDTTGASSLLTTVGDLALWDENFYSGKVGGQAFLEQMMATFTLNSGKTIDYRFGQLATKFRGLSVVEHSGSDAGYRAHYMRLPGERFSVACLCNLPIDPGSLSREVAASYLEGKLGPEPKRDSPQPIEISPSELPKYTGLYWNPDDEEVLRIEQRDGKLGIRFTGFAALTPIASGRFRTQPPPDQEITFVENGLQLKAAGSAESRDYRRVEPWTDPDLAAFGGDYYSEEIDSTYRIELREGKLVLHRKKQRTHEVQPTFRDSFYSPQLGYLRFTRDGAGKPVSFRLTPGRVQNLKFVRR